jgi:hypothetical protein
VFVVRALKKAKKDRLPVREIDNSLS